MANVLDWLLKRSRSNEVSWIEVADLKHRLDHGEPLLVVDVRGPEEFAGPLGHITGAVNLPLPEVSSRLAELLSDQRPIVFVCLTDKRSSQAATTLSAAGHAHVAVLRGGMQRWRDEACGEPR